MLMVGVPMEVELEVDVGELLDPFLPANAKAAPAAAATPMPIQSHL